MASKKIQQHAPDERSHLVASLDSQVTTPGNYQTVSDAESPYESDHNNEQGEERYSHAFVVQVVGALLIGKYRQWTSMAENDAMEPKTLMNSRRFRVQR
jgi:hypothetical protein